MAGHHLRFGPLTNCAHLCVDMQRLFHEETPWHVPWLGRILPTIVELVEAAPERTYFSRFIPLHSSDDASGTWKRYYEHWSSMTLDALDPGLVDLVAPLALHVPPGRLIDKHHYSPWIGTTLGQDLQARGVDTLIISGAETEVCVAAAVMGALDLGYRVVVPEDALCSSADESHDAMLTIFHGRFSMQVELAPVAEIIEAWRPTI
ncbi:MAG: cysteine hydrolase [Sphingobium sp.]|nr:cysteine hydrolase [Sphingobium sp.]